MENEKEIIKRIQNGEIDCFEFLVKKYSKILHFYTKKRIGDAEDAKDIVQTSFINAYKAIDGFDSSKNFYPFIFSILKNEVFQFFRKRKNHFKLNENLIQEDNLQSDKITLNTILKNIKKEHSKVLKLYYIEGFSYKEIAGKINRPINTVKTLLRRAKMEAKGHV